MKIALLTPTGDRPEAFALCERWISRAWGVIGTVEWFVVDDGVDPTRPTMNQTWMRIDPMPGTNTLPRNLKILLQQATWWNADAALIIEDDEYYSPTYVCTMANRLASADLVGEVPAHYYNVARRRWGASDIVTQASLCRTGVSVRAFQALVESIEIAKQDGNPFIDKYLWGTRKGVDTSGLKKNLFPALAGKPLSVGIKEMPGRAGLGGGHRPLAYRNADPTLAKLREWIGADAEAYEKFYSPELAGAKR